MKVPLKSNESGFTLLEALIALMLSSVILLFLSAGLLQLTKFNELIVTGAQTMSIRETRVKGNRQIEWHLFLNQLEGYLEDSHLVSSTIDTLVVEEESGGDQPNTVKYGRAKTGQRNFFRSNKSGYNALLTDVRSFHLKVDDQWLILNFLFQNGEEYKGRIWIESWKEEENQEVNLLIYNQRKVI